MGAARSSDWRSGWRLRAWGSGAPPRSGRAAPAAPGAGRGESGRCRQRAVSLPAALPARWRWRRRPRQTMNLPARRAEVGLGPALLGPVFLRLPRPPSGGRPLAADPGGAAGAPGTRRGGLPRGGAEARMSPPRLEVMRPELGDRGQVDKVVALRTVKAVGGRTLRGSTGRLSRAAPRVGIRAPPRRATLEPAGGGPTDGQAQCLHRVSTRWERNPPAPRSAPRTLRGSFQAQPGAVTWASATPPRLQLGAPGRCPKAAPSEGGGGSQALLQMHRDSEGDRGRGPGRRRARGRARSGLNFCSPPPLPSSPPFVPCPLPVPGRGPGGGETWELPVLPGGGGCVPGWSEHGKPSGAGLGGGAVRACGAAGSRVDAAGATRAVVKERESAGLCVRVERTRRLWAEEGARWSIWRPLSPLRSREGDTRAKGASPWRE